MEDLTQKLIDARNDAMKFLKDKGWSDADIARIFKVHPSTVLRALN